MEQMQQMVQRGEHLIIALPIIMVMGVISVLFVIAEWLDSLREIGE